MSKDLFVDKNPSLETSWRSIILLGRNVASYKFALAKSLLEIDSNNSEIELEKLAIPFAKNICEHLDKNEKQITSSSSKFLDACKRFNNSQINEDELKNITVRMGFNNVIDAFHIVSREETIINQTGKSQEDRRHFLQKMYDLSIDHIPVKWKPNDLYGESL